MITLRISHGVGQGGRVRSTLVKEQGHQVPTHVDMKVLSEAPLFTLFKDYFYHPHISGVCTMDDNFPSGLGFTLSFSLSYFTSRLQRLQTSKSHNTPSEAIKLNLASTPAVQRIFDWKTVCTASMLKAYAAPVSHSSPRKSVPSPAPLY